MKEGEEREGREGGRNLITGSDYNIALYCGVAIYVYLCIYCIYLCKYTIHVYMH